MIRMNTNKDFAGERHARQQETTEVSLCRPARYLLMALAWLNVGLGVLGLFLPLMPTTVFLLVALWLFSKSSIRFHHWLYSHPKLGRTLRAWHDHGAIPRAAKLAAVTVMAASWLSVALFMAEDWVLPTALAVVLVPIAAFITSRPSVSVRTDGIV